MHELGIVVHVINQVEKLAKENNVNKVVEVTLEIGEVSGVVKEYFVDAFNWAIKKTEYMKECSPLPATRATSGRHLRASLQGPFPSP